MSHTTGPMDRPDLRKESVVFSTIKGAGMGAVVGVGINLLTNALSKSARVDITHDVVSWAAMWGAGTLIESLARNRQKEATRPYVERLEGEITAKNAALADSVIAR